MIFSLTDETYSLICSPDLPDDINRKDYFFIVSLVNQLSWIAGSIIGSVLGNIIPFDTTGIDFAMTALFVIILLEQLEKSKQHLLAFTGFIITLWTKSVPDSFYDSYYNCIIHRKKKLRKE